MQNDALHEISKAKECGEKHDEPGEPKLSIVRPNPNDVSDMAFIRGGKFVRGSTFEENQTAFKMCRKNDRSCKLWWFSDEYPLKLVMLQTYLIDIYEVTNEKYLQFVEATGHPPALDDSCTTDACREGNLWKGASFPSRIRKQPVTQVSWYDAEVYCKWRGKRLPTEAEWEKAARGPSGSMYPWGNAFPKRRATFKRKWQGPNTMTNVGSYPNGVSVYGVHDMAGNVWEHCSDLYRPDYFKTYTSQDIQERNPKGPPKEDAVSQPMVQRYGQTGKYPDEKPFHQLAWLWVTKGGSHLCHHTYCLRYRPAARHYSESLSPTNHTGFRCAKSK